jgi:hypothetical protein
MDAVSFTRRELRESLGWSEHQVRIGLGGLVALEYLVAVPGGSGRQHRYLLADDPPGQPRDTPRTVRDPDPRGQNGTYASETDHFAVDADAVTSDDDRVVAVGVDPDRGTRGVQGGTFGGAR